MAACPVLDESQATNDLYSHRVQKAVSTDGVSFALQDTILLEHASVPDAVVRTDGEIWVYFINGQPGQHAIFIARQADDGLLEVFDCVRFDGQINPNSVDPDIVLLADGRYRIFYFTGWFDGVTGPPPDAPHPIYSAISEDGVHFEQEQLLMKIDGGGTDPTAVEMPDGSWLLAYAYPEGARLASSSDGTDFTDTGQVFDQGIPELHRFSGGTIRAYIAGRDGLSVWSSDDDGRSWTEEAQQSLPGADPSLIWTGDQEWTLFGKTFEPQGSGPGDS